MEAVDCLDIQGENWMSWVTHQCQILDNFDLLPFIDTQVVIPAGVEGESVQMRDKIVINNIFLNVTAEVRELLDSDTAYNCWNQLKSHFQQSSRMAQMFFKKDLQNTVMTEGTDPEKHFRDLQSKHRRLANSGKLISDDDFITLALSSLPESYDSFCQSIDWDSISVNKLLQSIQLFGLRMKRRDNVSAFATNSKRKPGPDRSKLQCSHCSGHRHTEEECCADGGKNATNRPANYRGRTKPKANVAATADIAPSASLVAAPTEFYAAFMTVSPHEQLRFTTNRQITHVARYLHDSGANRHLFIEHDDFHNYSDIADLPIRTATPNAPLIAKGEGSVFVRFCFNGSETNFLLKNVLHVPNVTENLISTGALQNARVTQIIDKDHSLYLQFKARIFAKGVRCGDNLFALDLKVVRTSGPISLITAALILPFTEAHRHLNHIGFDKLERMRSADQTGGLRIGPREDFVCDLCLEANLKRLPFHARESKSSTKLEHMHMDLAGPLAPSIEKHMYFLVLRDDFSRFAWVITLPSKDSVTRVLISFDNMCLTQFG